MKHGDYVGVLNTNGKIGCPIAKVASVLVGGFTLDLPGIGETRIYRNDENIWKKVDADNLAEVVDDGFDCTCCRCKSPLFELAFSAE